VTTDQLCLLEGDAAAQWRFTLESILSDALRIVRTAATDDGPASEYDLARALELVERIATELRSLPQEPALPF
jgi:hypothetical protein